MSEPASMRSGAQADAPRSCASTEPPFPPGTLPPSRFDYVPTPEAFDEMAEPSGAVREHWRPFLLSIESRGMAELRRGWAEAQHLIREHGITYNVYGDPNGRQKSWKLDPIPLLAKSAL